MVHKLQTNPMTVCEQNPSSFIYKIVSQFFEFLIFSQDIQGNVHYIPEINLISEETMIKAFYLAKKTI